MGMTNTAAPTPGQTVTIAALGAWHCSLTGTLTEIDTVREIAVVQFESGGLLRVPVALILPA